MPTPIERLNAALQGRYRMERQLGEGGMATVYLAEDLKHHRKVALKVLKPELAAVVGAERFLAEIETTANLTHPHILPLHDSGEAEFATDGTSGPGALLYYVMPYVEGESLRERLDREHQLPVDEAVGIATNVAEALDYAHRQGVLHRDIKPANILLQDGKPVISDFGIALAVGAAGGGRLTETGLSMGTPHYMSPEQATGDASLSPATDIYALGCVLYEMLVGEPPFTGSTPQAVLGKIITGEVPTASDERSSVPPHVDGVIRKALEKLPADRFRSAGEFAGAIADPGFRHGTDRAGAAAGVSPRAWRSLAIGALLVALIATGAASGVLLRAPPPEAPRPIRFTLTSAADGGVRPTGGYLAVSPDGDEVVFIGVEDGQVRLYRRSLASPEVRPIPGTEDVRSTFAFSPDGGSVAFWTPDQILRTVPLEGGAALPLAEVPDPPIGLGWSSEVGVVMGMLAYNFSFRGLSAADQRQEGIRAITSPEDIQMHHDAYVLEGGRHALHVHWRPGGNRHSLARTSLTDGTTETFDIPGTSVLGALGVVGVADGVLLFRDAAGLLMAAHWDDENLAPVGSPMRVPDVPSGLRYAYLAADGTLAMAVSADEFDIVLADDRGRVISTVSDESVESAYPRFSPDGGGRHGSGSLVRGPGRAFGAGPAAAVRRGVLRGPRSGQSHVRRPSRR